METEQNIWRLPSVEEAVRSMMLHGENAGGVWYADIEKAVYEKTPDKETPLWDVNSKVIYYWTADTSIQDEKQAYIIVYDGGIYDKRKIDRQGYLSFRAVKSFHPPKKYSKDVINNYIWIGVFLLASTEKVSTTNIA